MLDYMQIAEKFGVDDKIRKLETELFSPTRRTISVKEKNLLTAPWKRRGKTV